MKIDTPEGRAIYRALRENTEMICLDLVHQLISEQELLDRSIKLARAINENQEVGIDEDRPRTFEQILRSTLLGKQAEAACAVILASRNLDVKLNDEEITGEYGHDLSCEGLRIEVKTQFPSPGKEYFSFNDKRKSINFVQSSNQHHLVVAMVPSQRLVLETYYELVFSPWLLIDSTAIRPESELFVDSRFQGMYLQMNKTQDRGLLHYLNPLPDMIINDE
jgi:hypothetical protein